MSLRDTRLLRQAEICNLASFSLGRCLDCLPRPARRSAVDNRALSRLIWWAARSVATARARYRKVVMRVAGEHRYAVADDAPEEYGLGDAEWDARIMSPDQRRRPPDPRLPISARVLFLACLMAQETETMPGHADGPVGGPGGRGSTGPGGPFLGRRDGLRWSGGVREGLGAVPCGDDRCGPGPGGGDLEGLAAPAAHEPGGGVEGGRRVFGSALASLPSRARCRSQDSRMQAVIDASSQDLFSP